jgi:hypothetical protein
MNSFDQVLEQVFTENIREKSPVLLQGRGKGIV